MLVPASSSLVVVIIIPIIIVIANVIIYYMAGFPPGAELGLSPKGVAEVPPAAGVARLGLP